MNPTYIIVAIILCGLFHVSIQVCFMDPGSFHYYYSRAIFCSNVTNLKDEIKTVEYSDYMNNLKVNDSNFITIDNFFTTHNHLFSLTISTCKIGTIATSAFKNIDLSKLIIENNKINYLSIGAFNASLMTSLSLRNNSLTDIDSNIFSGNIPNLRSLDLSYNNIKSITGFMNIPSLTKFDISHNYNFQSNSLLNLNKLTSLKELNINNCNLDSIPTEGLSELKSLEKIDMSENKFIRLRGNDFPPSLISLFASNNSISHITNSWNHLKNLTTLDLSNNYLAGQNFPFEDCISMITLELKNNKLDDYSLNNMFDKLNNISVVNLDNNKLTKLDCNMLTNKGQLKVFFVSSNNINHLINPEKCPKSIENFNMSNNRLSSVSSFSEMSNLTQLDLSNNELEILNYDTFKNLKKLNTMYLNNNKLKSWPIGCFRDLNSLETLKLEHN